MAEEDPREGGKRFELEVGGVPDRKLCSGEVKTALGVRGVGGTRCAIDCAREAEGALSGLPPAAATAAAAAAPCIA